MNYYRGNRARALAHVFPDIGLDACRLVTSNPPSSSPQNCELIKNYRTVQYL